MTDEMENRLNYRNAKQHFNSNRSSRELSVPSSSLSTSSAYSECSSSSSTQSPSSELLYDYMELSFSTNPDSYSSCDNWNKSNAYSYNAMHKSNNVETENYYGMTTSNLSTVEAASTEADEFYDVEWDEQEEPHLKCTLEFHSSHRQRPYEQQQMELETKQTASMELCQHKRHARHASEIISVLSTNQLNASQVQKIALHNAITTTTITEDNKSITKPMLTSDKTRNKNTKEKSNKEHESVESHEQAKKQHTSLTKVSDNVNNTSTQSSLQLISQHFVAQSSFTERNPFRTQTFAEFCAHPEYSPPSGFELYSDAVKDVVYHGYTIAPATEGEYLTKRLLRYALMPDTQHNRQTLSTSTSHLPSSEEQLRRISTLRNQLFSMHRGTWLYKWTRTNYVQRRFVWLDLQVGEIMWSRSPHSWIVKSQLRIAEIVNVIPDTITNSVNEKMFYRFIICTSTRRLYFATELLDKFKMWFTILRQLTEMNTCDGIPGIGSRPSSKVYGNQGVISRWALRYSPLQALMDEE